MGRSSAGNDLDLRLLLRIAHVRWLAIVLGLSFPFTGMPPGPARWTLFGGTAVAAAYNGAAVGLCMLRRCGAQAVALLTVFGDLGWVVAASVALGLAEHPGAGLGGVAFASECALVLGWRGAGLGAVAGTAALLAGAAVTAHVAGTAVDLTGVLYSGVVLAVAASSAALSSTELHDRNRELHAQAASLAQHARTDHLTGLANQLAFDEAVRAQGRRPFALLLVDVDGMRWTNHVYGHQAGDELLHAVANLLRNVTDAGELAARVAEDKFFVLLPVACRARALELAESVRIAAHGIAVSAGRLRLSVGCAWRAAGEAAGEVLTRADDALVAAKAAGGDRVEEQVPADGPGRWRLRATVDSVLAAERGVYSVFQRIVRLRDGATVAWEALSRPREWPPDTDVEALFLTAHRIGRARDLDWRCRQNALWEAGRLDAPLFINVHAGALLDPVHGADQMELLCRWAGRSPDTVVLELSERDGTPDLNRLQEVLAEYRGAGFRFAVDDLGQGQTSFEMVLAARAEFFKLARPMVQAASRDAAAYAAVRALVGFAHDIGSVVIAEGIEDEATRDLCVELEIDCGQGWLYGRPQRADRLPPA